MSAQSWRGARPTSSRLFRASVLIGAMLLLSSQAALAQFSQDGNKLVGMLATGAAEQGYSVALSADGDTAIVGGPSDNGNIGAAWVFTRSGQVWTQQSGKLVGTGAVGPAEQGYSVALSADGDTAIVGGPWDNSQAGAAWVFTRSGGVWTQQEWTQQKMLQVKLVGTGAVGSANLGASVALSADGDTAIVGGPSDKGNIGAAWVFTRSGGVWTQQEWTQQKTLQTKLVGTGWVGEAYQGQSVALSADGVTAIVGGPVDNAYAGAAWVFTQSGGVWTQQGGKLVGTGAVRTPYQGGSVALSGDGKTAIVGGYGDNSHFGAAWVFARSGVVWTQQGGKLVGAGAVGEDPYQGFSVALSGDGDTAIVGGIGDKNAAGATWVYTRSGAVWTQQGGKLVGAGAVGRAEQGYSVALSGDGDTAIESGPWDNSNAGAAWVFVQPLEVSPYTGIAASGPHGGPFLPSSFSYTLSATSGGVKYSITNVPSWLTASSTSGTLTRANTIITFKINSSADALASGAHVGSINFNNTTGAQASISRAATLTVNP